MYAIRSYYDDGLTRAVKLDDHIIDRDIRITSYNVCYTKLLRGQPALQPLSGPGCRITSYNVCYTKLLRAQQGLWNIVPQFFGFVTFVISGIALTHRHPFDQPEAEQELADGYHIEYAGMKWGMFFVGEYIGIVMVSTLLVTLFFGGWHGPWLPPVVWFALKTGFFIMLFILLRASLPRPRYDQVMAFGWKICLPLTLINLLVTGALVLTLAE